MSESLGLARRPRSWQLWLGSICLGLMLMTSAIPAFSGSAQAWAKNEDEESVGEREVRAAEDDDKPLPSFLMWLNDTTGHYGHVMGIELLLLLFFALRQGMVLQGGNFAPPLFVAALEKKLAGGDGELGELLKNDKSFLARELAAGIRQLSHGFEAAQIVMRTTGQFFVLPLDRSLTYILLIAITAPLLGLLGTMVGMMNTLTVIADSSNYSNGLLDLHELAGPLTTMLMSIFEGVLVGIPAIVAYVLLKQRQHRLVLETEWLAERLLGQLLRPGKTSDHGAEHGDGIDALEAAVRTPPSVHLY